MTVVLLDQEMDRAEAFRLAKRLRLPPEVVLSSDGSIVRSFAFYRLFGLDAYPVVQRLMGMSLDVGMSETLGSVDVPYADRLSHLVDLEDPVTFVDLRELSADAFRSQVPMPSLQSGYVTIPMVNRPGEASGEREPPEQAGRVSPEGGS